MTDYGMYRVDQATKWCAQRAVSCRKLKGKARSFNKHPRQGNGRADSIARARRWPRKAGAPDGQAVSRRLRGVFRSGRVERRARPRAETVVLLVLRLTTRRRSEKSWARRAANQGHLHLIPLSAIHRFSCRG
eukprot:6205349-Pleurochrysis_carterae.AAC.6